MRRTLDQLLSLFNTMAASQKMTLLVITLAIPGALLFLTWNGSTSSYIPLSYGKLFSVEEMRNAEQSLKEAGLIQFRSEGRQILAPRNDVEKYNNALLQSGSLPANWAEELEKKLDKSSGLFSTPEQLQALKESALATELQRILMAGPDFEDARVVWASSNSRRPRGSRSPRVTATVNVKPRHGRELSTEQVRSLRSAVAGMISADLSPSDVVIFDMSTTRSYTADKDGESFDSGLVTWIRENTRMYEDKTRESLSFIPGVVVSVNVNVENLKRSVETSVNYDPKKIVAKFQQDETTKNEFTQQPTQGEPGSKGNEPRSLSASAANQQTSKQDGQKTTVHNETSYTVLNSELIKAFPKQVTVAVAIPQEYYQKALEKQSTADGQAAAKTPDQLKQEVETTVKSLAASAIPNGKAEQINVSTFVKVDPETLQVETSIVTTLTTLAGEWGGSVVLALLALWALRTLMKSLPRTAPELPAPVPQATVFAPRPTGAAALDEEEPEDAPPDTKDRDRLQSMVKDNPEMTAAVLSKWLQAVK